MRRDRRDLLRGAAALGATALVGPSGATAAAPTREAGEDPPTDPSIRVPARTLVGEQVRIRLAGFAPDADVAVTATATDSRGVEFARTWTRRTDASGAATIGDAGTDGGGEDVRTAERRGDARAAGATTRPDRSDSRWTALGPGFDAPEPPGVEMLLHRLTPRADSPPPPRTGSLPANRTTTARTPTAGGNAAFIWGDRPTVEVRLTARAAGERRATATLTRVRTDPGVTRRTVESDGLVGWLYRPPGDGPRPGVLVLHGSQAVVPHRLSRQLATYGYATLALQYVGADGLPASVDDVPLEYFGRAVRWLADRDGVRDDRTGFVGFSRGVEAALLAAADFPGEAVAVGYSGSGVCGPGVNEAANAVTDWGSAWTRDGDPVAGADAVRPVFRAVRALRYSCETPDCALAAVRERVEASTLRRAAIPVEEIDGPVLLLAGANDATWPAPVLSALAVDRLRRRGHGAPYQLRTYDGAGHVFYLPYYSYAGDLTGPAYGGSPAANAFAAADSWPTVLRYLRAGLRTEA
ncbi:acyl-CoA thioester hydrolase/BAAT C-terminal domain-containing protein [Halorussus sp. AFM4]|uniref:acyl-CoA thioester hydrolase/BAAT C-terminal domain-containing protein n=1 Tax=Halorussus sp. AFM4 TaxID=3421651 RepID=UPI003EB9C1D0